MERRSPCHLIALIWFAACSNGCQEPRLPCSAVTIRSRLVSGRITFALGPGPLETHALSPANAPLTLAAESGACVASAPVTELSPSDSSASEVIVGCEPSEGSLRVVFGGIEPRRLALGPQAAFPSRQASIDWGAGTDSCSSRCAQVAATADVTRAQASADLVSIPTDYVREYSAHVDFGGASESVSESGHVCPAPSGRVDLDFVETAADVVRAECPDTYPSDNTDGVGYM